MISLLGMQEDEIKNCDNEELLKFLFKPGFTTRSTVSMQSGRGVGLDFVYHTLKKRGGDVKIRSTKGRGTTISLIVPVPEN
jgi:chemotaxis protein histidine kinase CheA